MKTNFTMTKRFLFAIALLAVVVSSCSDDDAPTVVPGAGIYEFGSATLVDGDVNDDGTTNLVLRNVVTAGGVVPEITLPKGESDNTSGFVDAVLTGAAPCVEGGGSTADWTYQMNLKSDLKVAFICTSENDLSEDIGSWQLLNDNTTLSMSISVSFSPIAIPIVLNDVVITDTQISGTVESFPMVKYILYGADAPDPLPNTPMPIGGPIDGDATNTDASNSNLQFISVDIVLDKVQ
jgi:hypothetical protein